MTKWIVETNQWFEDALNLPKNFLSNIYKELIEVALPTLYVPADAMMNFFLFPVVFVLYPIIGSMAMLGFEGIFEQMDNGINSDDIWSKVVFVTHGLTYEGAAIVALFDMEKTMTKA